MARQRLAQRRAGVDEGGTGQVQAHDLHQHLVRVGGAVEGAGAGAVVGPGLGFQQLRAADLAFGIKLADVGLLLVADAGGHRPARHEHGRQVAEGQRTHHQARHDLVAHAQVQHAVEHLVGQRHGGGHGDHVAREQRQVHPILALRHAIAHGRGAAGELRRAAGRQRGLLDPAREGFQRLVGGQHVVVGRDDGQVGALLRLEADLGVIRHGGHAVGEVGAGQVGALDLLPGHGAGAVEISLARGAAAGHDAGRNPLQDRVAWHGVFSCEAWGASCGAPSA
ncbi:hypothetical protein D3C72_577460 [compost metagenome]